MNPAGEEGVGRIPVPGEADLCARLRWLLVLRVLVVSSLLVALALLQYARSPLRLEASLPFLQALGGGTYLATIAYALTMWRRRDGRRLAQVQLVGDVLLVTGLIHVTGGIDSGFSFLYLLTIIVGAILFSRPGAFWMAIGCTAAYGGLLGAQAAGWVRVPPLFVTPAGYNAPWEVVANVGFNAAVFFVVALLCGYLADQLRFTSEQLREKEDDLARLRNLTLEIVASMGSGLLTVDAEDRITFVNPTGERIIGQAGKLVGCDLRSVFPGLPDRSEGDTPRRSELRYRRSDGTSLVLGCSFSLLEGGSGGRILIFQDLTEVKAAEERAHSNERLAAVGRLSAGMAHEIRNPLASIRGSIEVLARELTLSGDQDRLMRVILRETDRLNLLISDFLQFARPPEAKKQPVPVAELLAETTEAFSCRSKGGGPIELRVNAPVDLLADGDPAQIRQIIWNILLNACEAMPEGGCVDVRARRVESLAPGIAQGLSEGSRREDESGNPRGWIELCFADDGVGITADVLPRIFEPFFTTKERGTGLGLAVVYRIVEGHGGSVDVKSESGKGTVFTVMLPAFAPADFPLDGREGQRTAADSTEGRV